MGLKDVSACRFKRDSRCLLFAVIGAAVFRNDRSRFQIAEIGRQDLKCSLCRAGIIAAECDQHRCRAGIQIVGIGAGVICICEQLIAVRDSDCGGKCRDAVIDKCLRICFSLRMFAEIQRLNFKVQRDCAGVILLACDSDSRFSRVQIVLAGDCVIGARTPGRFAGIAHLRRDLLAVEDICFLRKTELLRAECVRRDHEFRSAGAGVIAGARDCEGRCAGIDIIFANESIGVF